MKGKNKRKKYHSYRGEVGKIAENLLKQNFHTTAPNQKWVTDVSEFKCAEGKLYLSPIKDLFNGEIIAYDVARNPSFEQISRIMKRAVARLDGATPILYSDQGWQYQMASYQSNKVKYVEKGKLVCREREIVWITVQWKVSLGV
ncbi:integrase core domain protein [Glaesserella parasuis H465]|nr:integrase core domain protein [Glaesserella parasuis H465]